MKIKNFLVGLCFLTWLTVPAANATTMLSFQIEDMAKLSPIIIIGEVNQVYSSFNSDKTKIHTRALISPVEILKGPADLGTVTVKTIGGQVGSKVASLPGAPKFEVGERVLVFLEPREDGDGYLTLGFFQGKYKIFKDPKTGREMLLRDEPGQGVTLLGGQPGQKIESARSLDEVRAVIRKVGGAK
jgi:hypothetical protein